MPDPIRSALHAAALATMTAAERDNSDRFHNGQPGPGHIRRAAETVAAFLRTLSSDVVEELPASAYHFRMHLAAAVERAAQGEKA